MTGYYVRPDALRSQTRVYDEQHTDMEQVRDNLRAAFDRDGNTLGSDLYGAELAKKLPGIEKHIFTALDAYIKELEHTSTGLHRTADTYELADRIRLPGS
ncbi:hypothetical protein SAMN05421505_14022 [Sinosporangium album]|uniref:Excreted virulence factor EspC, type VII ESX diderm n=1 Tax=Sinosporangium album TaxID=504805 RepID=A0A1G8IZY8_9ACTN|nr:hypothetical protein [Sinosporangium album]SDI24373.1 hypothetical protein SAMN05421505_14022 [Sinosporangium album]